MRKERKETTTAALRRDLTDLLPLANDTQIAAVLRQWANDTNYDHTPRFIVADLVARMSAELDSDYYTSLHNTDSTVNRMNAILKVFDQLPS